MCYGRLLGVGESGRNVATVCPVLVINSNTFDEHDGSKRPPGWLTIRNQRILLKELEDRLNQISETDIREKRDDREIEVFIIFMLPMRHLIIINIITFRSAYRRMR